MTRDLSVIRLRAVLLVMLLIVSLGRAFQVTYYAGQDSARRECADKGGRNR